MEKRISAELYLGLLLAQEEAGGNLIPEQYERGSTLYGSFPAKVRDGQDSAGCLFGSLYFFVGYEPGYEDELSNHITVHEFDKFASRRKKTTVDDVMRHFNIDIVE